MSLGAGHGWSVNYVSHTKFFFSRMHVHVLHLVLRARHLRERRGGGTSGNYLPVLHDDCRDVVENLCD